MLCSEAAILSALKDGQKIPSEALHPLNDIPDMVVD